MFISAITRIGKQRISYLLSGIFPGACYYKLIQIDAPCSNPFKDVFPFTQLYICPLYRMCKYIPVFFRSFYNLAGSPTIYLKIKADFPIGCYEISINKISSRLSHL